MEDVVDDTRRAAGPVVLAGDASEHNEGDNDARAILRRGSSQRSDDDGDGGRTDLAAPAERGSPRGGKSTASPAVSRQTSSVSRPSSAIASRQPSNLSRQSSAANRPHPASAPEPPAELGADRSSLADSPPWAGATADLMEMPEIEHSEEQSAEVSFEKRSARKHYMF